MDTRNTQRLIAERNNISARLRELAAASQRENRDMTEAETAEVRELSRRDDMLRIELRAAEAAIDRPAERPFVGMMAYVRERNTKVAFELREAGAETTTPTPDTMRTADVTAGGMVPLTIGDVIEPIHHELIWDKIGIQLPTGLAGSMHWPVVGSSIKAEFAGESVELTRQRIDLSKVDITQQRMGLTIGLSWESAFNSENRIRNVITNQIPQAVAEALNAMICSTTTDANSRLQGPFVKAPAFTWTAAKSAFFNFNKAKASLLSKGYSTSGLVWVMSEGKKAELEATPKDAGSGIMLVENDRLCGLPIFCGENMGDTIGLGDFRYQVIGQYGTPRLTIDPTTGATKDEVYYTLNTYYGTATLRQDAFLKVTMPA